MSLLFYNIYIMNQTKKLTQGAMMLAIVGALILIDRLTAYWFTEIVVLIIPIVLIMYSAMHTLKDGLLLSVGLLIITLLLGNLQFTYLIFVPVGIATGLAYSYGVSKNKDKRTLTLIAICVYAIGELIATFIVYPLLGFPVSQFLEEYQLALNEAGNIVGMNYGQIFASVGLDFTKLLGVIYVVSTIVTGAMEGFLISVLSTFMLKRFKIKDLGNINLWQQRPNKALAYISFACVCLLFVAGKIENEVLYYLCSILGILGGIVLLYHGYMFFVFYGAIVLKRNISWLVILFAVMVPVAMILLVIVGFLYGSGPLRNYLESKVNKQ